MPIVPESAVVTGGALGTDGTNASGGPIGGRRPLHARRLLRRRLLAITVVVLVASAALSFRIADADSGYDFVGLLRALGHDAAHLRWQYASTDGTCRFCRAGKENLCLNPTFTGWDTPGGYADYCIADEGFCYALPDEISDERAAPLLCAGIIGYRALKLSGVEPGGALAIYGFGASAHLTAQLALHLGMRVHVLTRGPRNAKLAADLGVDSVGAATDPPPEPVDGAILFAPAGELVAPALAGLDRGATLAIAGIWLSDIERIRYEQELFQEKALRSVTANTRRDGEEFLALAQRFKLRPTTHPYPMGRAPQALSDLAHGRFDGAAGLHNQ
jgi:propanol-preferring alcohol dehydrogenase